MDTIKFDEDAVDMNLAKEYLERNKIFNSKGFSDSKETASNVFENIIHFSDYKRRSGLVMLCNDVSDVPQKLYNLAKKIEENSDLFCQLELLIRKIPLEDTKYIDLKLITKNLLYYYNSSRGPQVARTLVREIVVCKDSPLLALGCVAQVLMAGMPRVVIECTLETTPVCSLFTDLCHTVGLKEKVLLAILPQISENNMFKVTVNFGKIRDFHGGVGIVSAKSDVDSAVDTFLEASCRYPWALKKIFVQESVLERFKRALSWKAHKGEIVEASCVASFRCGEKLFALEGAGAEGAGVVELEAYRTVRELLALLGALRPLAVSLWSSDVAESLEIAHGLDTSVIWINDFDDFRGPPQISQAFYSVIDCYLNTDTIEHMPEFDKVTEFRKSWLELDIKKRKDLVLNALSIIDSQEAKQIIEAIVTQTFEMDNFVHVSKNVVTTGVEFLPELMLYSPNYYDNLDVSLVLYIIKGGAVLLHISENLLKIKSSSFFYMFYKNLGSLGAPVLFTKKEHKFGNISIIRNPVYRKKVIWTNYGTIFSN